MKHLLKTKPYSALRLKASNHFTSRLTQRMFDLSVLLPFYKAMIDADIGEEIEVSIGRASVVGSKISKTEAVVKSGWAGERKDRGWRKNKAART